MDLYDCHYGHPLFLCPESKTDYTKLVEKDSTWYIMNVIFLFNLNCTGILLNHSIYFVGVGTEGDYYGFK